VKILIADDDATSRLLLTGALHKFGHEVIAKVDGTEAWEAMRGPGAPMLAILDWMMPGLAGVEVCRRVRSLGSDEPPYLILLTSMTEKADIAAGLEAGADDYLAKPFDAGELRARVEVGRRLTELQARLGEARDALAQAAMHDPLTGALNRRAFAVLLSGALPEERRHGQGLALGICDVDDFKTVNDTYGHQVGDEVLCGVVRQLESGLRANDVLSRHGGDEFVVLAGHLGDADRASIATSLFERLRASVADHPIPTAAGDISITISCGVSLWCQDLSEAELLAAADTALYGAKHAGRNRVVVAAEPRAS
jgi:two-component system, cell cycle response regulator